MRAKEDQPEERSPEEIRLAKGRLQLIAVAVTLLGSLGLRVVLGIMPISGAAVWAAPFALLAFQMFRGRTWAKWVTMALSALLGAGCAIVAAELFGGGPDSEYWSINAALAVMYAWVVLVLWLSKPLAGFMHSQRARDL